MKAAALQSEFLAAVGRPHPSVPHRDMAALQLSWTLVKEELKEFAVASAEYGSVEPGDRGALLEARANITAEAADLIYVIADLMNMQGLPLDAMYQTIHGANMRKVDPNTGQVRRREDGKILKPAGWYPADTQQVIRLAQILGVTR